MAVPKWSTPERRTRLVQLAQAHKGRCLQGQLPCDDLEHFIHRHIKTEVSSHPVSAADVRAGRAIAFPCHGVGIVELAQAVSGGPVIGPMRVAVVNVNPKHTHRDDPNHHPPGDYSLGELSAVAS
jgi:hypothetical protein